MATGRELKPLKSRPKTKAGTSTHSNDVTSKTVVEVSFAGLAFCQSAQTAMLVILYIYLSEVAIHISLKMVGTVVILTILLWTSAHALVSPLAEPSLLQQEVLTVSRRETLASIFGVGATLWGSKPALAASQEETDKANIVKGYKRLSYLLDNWEKETTVCKTGQETTFGDRCERTPIKVMEYLGYKSTNDPLFNVEKTLRRLEVLVPDDKEVDYVEATESLLQNAEEANSMAFVSSWGEANPGGGKDRVKLFIERSKNNVIISKKSLEAVIDILGLEM